MHSTALNWLFARPRPVKRALQLLADSVLLTVSFALAMLLRTESLGFLADTEIFLAFGCALPVSLIVFVRLGFYRAVIRYLGGRAFVTIIVGVAASAVAILCFTRLFGLPIPLAVPFIYSVLAFCTVGGIRFALRALFVRSQTLFKTRVVIYGAGRAGRQLCKSLMQGPDHAPVAFVDDASDLQGTEVAGLAIYPPARLSRIVKDYNVKTVLVAIPSASFATRARIISGIEPLSVRVRIVPDVPVSPQDSVRIGEAMRTAGIREVTVEDLLGRDPVPPCAALMRADITGKSVLVSGAGGSIGSELCRQILARKPRVLVLLDICEYGLYSIGQELCATTSMASMPGANGANASGPDGAGTARAGCSGSDACATTIIPLLGSVGDTERMSRLMHQFGVDTVFHAAAYKHVSIVEENIVEGVRNNVFGTLGFARAAVAAGVGNFILVSTDKAARPASVMGATKRMAELICLAFADEPGQRTRFSMVRFGNVLGSSGSVVPRFRAQIAAGGPVTVTHPDAARYFMTITEAAQLVIQAGAMARGGDLFVLDMGAPVRILDLAKRMVRLSGLVPVTEPHCATHHQSRATGTIPTGTMPIVFTALQPGEKLTEEPVTAHAARSTQHPRIMTATEDAIDLATLHRILDLLAEACRTDDLPQVRALLATDPSGYLPTRPIADLTWAAREDRPEPVWLQNTPKHVPESGIQAGLATFRTSGTRMIRSSQG